MTLPAEYYSEADFVGGYFGGLLCLALNISLKPKTSSPYRAMKEREMMFARELYREVSLRAMGSNIHKDELPSCLEVASAANALDSFKHLGSETTSANQ